MTASGTAEPVGIPQLRLVRGDITTLPVDVVVNAANSSLLGGGGVDGAIHRAGGPAILDACRELRRTAHPDGLPAGGAVATTAGRMPARWVVHTVGPVYGRTPSGADVLARCYRASLELAGELGATTIAFPLISAGAYGWPREDAVRTAIDSITAVAVPGLETASLVLFDEATLSLAERVRAER